MSAPARTETADRGVVLVWVALMVPVLVGMGALVIDIGALYDERRQLQNGADAAALAIVESCARGNCGDVTSLAATYADANARDGAATVEILCGSTTPLPACPSSPPGTENLPVGTSFASVGTKTRTSNGGDQLPFILAPALQIAQQGQTVRARTTVAWGTLGSSPVVPMGLPLCALDPSWVGPGSAINFPNTVQVIKLDASSRTVCPRETVSGTPNGFDFFISNEQCSAGDVRVIDGVVWLLSGNQGVGDIADPCKAFGEIVARGPIIMAVYDARDFTSNPARYRAIGFAAVNVCGYNLRGGIRSNAGCPTECSLSGNEVQVCGRFTSHTVAQGDFGLPGQDFGVRLIKGVG